MPRTCCCAAARSACARASVAVAASASACAERRDSRASLNCSARTSRSWLLAATRAAASAELAGRSGEACAGRVASSTPRTAERTSAPRRAGVQRAAAVIGPRLRCGAAGEGVAMDSAAPFCRSGGLRAGRSVLVLERREHVGGAAVSEQVFDGVDVRLSAYSYLVSLLPDRIVADLDLDLRLADRTVASYTALVREGRPSGLLVER